MISRSWSCLALFLCATLASAATPEPSLPLGDAQDHGVEPEQREALDRIIHEAVSAGDVPGVGLLVAHRGEILVRATYGSLGRWFGVETPTRIDSGTRPIVATAMMILVDRGLLSLDDPIDKYLPEFGDLRLEDGSKARAKPTVGQILWHGSGISGDAVRRLKEEQGGVAFLLSGITLTEVVREMAEDPLVSEPGTEFRYSLASDVGARVAEIVAGMPFDLFLQRQLLRPLGMSRTDFFPATSETETGDPPAGRYVQTWNGLLSTLDDLAVFLETHRRGGVFNGTRVLSDEAVALMGSPHVSVSEDVRLFGHNYGLGWFLSREDADGRPQTLSHGGGGGAMLWIDRDLDLVGVFLGRRKLMEILPLVDRVQGEVRSWFE